MTVRRRAGEGGQSRAHVGGFDDFERAAQAQHEARGRGFKAGVATFLSEEEVEGAKVLARGVWDRITPASCRWHQATSKDGGATWAPNWFMDWTRV